LVLALYLGCSACGGLWQDMSSRWRVVEEASPRGHGVSSDTEWTRITSPSTSCSASSGGPDSIPPTPPRQSLLLNASSENPSVKEGSLESGAGVALAAALLQTPLAVPAGQLGVPASLSEIADDTTSSGTIASIQSCTDMIGPLRGPFSSLPRVDSTCESVASSAQQFSEPGQTLIFFDWDDTLFPTTELFHRWSVPMHCKGNAQGHTLPSELEAGLASWREALHEYLSVACSLSDRCTIVTNSTQPWVDVCWKRFAPNLKSLFGRAHGGVHVVYATEALHDSLEDTTGSRASLKRGESRARKLTCGARPDPTAAKLAAMRNVAAQFYSRYPEQTWKNILSIGDMKYEHDAVQELALSRQSAAREFLRTKAILLPGGPSLSELTLRLRFSCLMLPAYVRFNGNIDLDLRRAPDPLEAIARALGIPELGSLEFPRHAWGRTPVPEQQTADAALDEVAVTVHDSLFSTHGVPLMQESAPSFPTQGHTSVSLVRGIAEGATAAVLAYAAAIKFVHGAELDVGGAENLVDLGYSSCALWVGAVMSSMMYRCNERDVLTAATSCSASRQTDFKSQATHTAAPEDILRLRPSAESFAVSMCRRSTGFLVANVVRMYLCSAAGLRSWIQRLGHHVVQVIMGVTCMRPGQGPSSRLCLLGASLMAELPLVCLRLTSTFRHKSSNVMLARLHNVAIVARLATGVRQLYLTNVARPCLSNASLRMQVLCTGAAHALSLA